MKRDDPAWIGQLGVRIRDARATAGKHDEPIRQAELARRTGRPRSSLNLVEHCVRVPSVHLLREIALGTGCSTDWMLGLAECPWCGRTVEETTASAHCAKESEP